MFEWDKAALALANANSKTINAISCGVATDEFHRISHVKTAQEAWKILETTYEGIKKVEHTNLQKLTTRFKEVKTSEEESFDSFYGRLNEIVIYNYVFYVGFNSVSNLIVFLFNHFPVFCVGLNVRVVCESLGKIYENGDFTIGLRVTTCERPCEKHMLESEESHARLDFASHFATQAKS